MIHLILSPLSLSEAGGHTEARTPAAPSLPSGHGAGSWRARGRYVTESRLSPADTAVPQRQGCATPPPSRRSTSVSPGPTGPEGAAATAEPKPSIPPVTEPATSTPRPPPPAAGTSVTAEPAPSYVRTLCERAAWRLAGAAGGAVLLRCAELPPVAARRRQRSRGERCPKTRVRLPGVQHTGPRRWFIPVFAQSGALGGHPQSEHTLAPYAAHHRPSGEQRNCCPS